MRLKCDRIECLPRSGSGSATREPFGLLEMFDAEEAAWSERVLSLGVERFERRLAEEIATLRVALVQAIHQGRVEMFKWSFVFWIGQVPATAALLAFMFRMTGR